VVWLIVDLGDGTNRTTAVAQTAFKAHERSGIQRDGRCLAYGECDVSYLERETQRMWLAPLFAFFEKVFAPRPKPNGHSKLNGKSNGRRS
jgi:hypothetical protein